MNTPARPRPLRVLAAGAAIGVAVLAAGALIAIVTQAITGRASPLPTTPPWRWSLDAIAHWFSTDATSSSAVDVAVRVLALVAWLALALIAVNLLRELAHQARHGVVRRRPDPVAVAPGRPSTSARPGRVRVRRQHGFASTIVAILLGGSTLVAPTATALPARVPAAAAVGDAPLTGGAAETPDALADPADDSELPAGWQWGTHTVTSPHESLASIARQLGDDPTIARTIWDANQGRDMGTGERFSDPAVVKVGWTLRVPTTVSSAPIVAPAAEGPAAPSETTAVPVASPASHVVVTEPGDTMWDQIDEVVDTPTATDVAAVAEANDGTTTPLGPWVFDADNPDLIHAGMPFDLQPAIDLHNPPIPIEVPPPDAPAATPTGGNESATAEAPTPAATTETAQAGPPSTALPAAETPATTAATPSAVDPGTTIDAAPPAPPSTLPASDVVVTAPAPTAVPGPVPAGAAPAVQPGDVAATPPAGPPVDTRDDPWRPGPIVPLAAGGMAIAGLVIGLDRRRRRRQAHDGGGRPVALPDGTLAAGEQVVRAAARLDRAARANAALRHLSVELAERATVVRARYILVDDDNVTVVLHQPGAAPDGWEAVEEPAGWRCTLDDTALAYAADVNPHPWPAVVPLGVTVDGDADILIDLEALGITGLGGPAGDAVCAAMICALGASPTADMVTVIDDGHVALYGLDRYLSNRIELAGIDTLLERLDAWTEPFRFEVRHLLAQRHDDPGELEPCVAAIVARVDDTARSRLHALPTDGTRPIAVITTDPSIARTLLEVNEHGLATFDGQTDPLPPAHAHRRRDGPPAHRAGRQRTGGRGPSRRAIGGSGGAAQPLPTRSGCLARAGARPAPDPSSPARRADRRADPPAAHPPGAPPQRTDRRGHLRLARPRQAR